MARLVIALDGLSRPQLRLLAGELAWFRALSASGELVDVDSRPLPCAQVAWAQLLTGAVWYQTGCAGWAVPAGSLGHLEVITDKHLQRPVTFPQKVNGRLFIANIPLFAPAGRQMAWLADGSLPLPSTVSPAELLKNARVAAYKPRPFSGLVFAIGEPFRAALACLDNEIERLETVLEVLRGKEWELVIIRLTLFDLLAHLLGPEFLDQAEHQLYETILSGLRKLDSLLDAISNTVPNTTVYGISMYSHATPVACVDLNLMLQEGGFCRFSHDSSAVDSFSRRISAVLPAAACRAGSADEGVGLLALESPQRLTFDCSATVAASPVRGVVYLNSCERFADGIVTAEALPDTVDEIASYLSARLSSEFGAAAGVWISPACAGRNDAAGGAMPGRQGIQKSAVPLACPDIVPLLPAVEYTLSAPLALTRRSVERVNKPLSTHVGEGFAIIPGLPASNGPLTPASLSHHLRK